MRRTPRYLAFCLIVIFLSGSGCGKKRIDDFAVDPDPRTIPQSAVKIRVADVSNNTPDLYDVDVIGLMWNALNDSLYRRGLLWMEETETPPLIIEARVQKYRKGNAIVRGVVPYFGNVELVVECDVKQGDRLVGTVESKRSISFADEVFTKEAWRKIFTAVGDDLVAQIAKRI